MKTLAIILTASALLAGVSVLAAPAKRPVSQTVHWPATPAPASAPAPTPDGKTLFHEKCEMCHGVGGMGTGLLGRRVKPALLEERTDLQTEYVIQAARTGIGNMPAIPRGEVSDPQLAAIAAYLAKKAPAK